MAAKPNGGERIGNKRPPGTATGTGKAGGKLGTQQPPAEGTGTGIEGDDEGTGTGIEAGDFIDPTEGQSSSGEQLGAAGDEPAPKRGRGRPPGSKTRNGKAKAEKIPTSLDGIEGILLSLHTMGATFAKVPELNLTDEEAKKLSAAIERVASLYDFGASEKTLAWVNLAMCVGGIYGTRVFAYSMRTKQEADEAKKRAPGPVLQFSTQPNTAAI